MALPFVASEICWMMYWGSSLLFSRYMSGYLARIAWMVFSHSPVSSGLTSWHNTASTCFTSPTIG